MAQFKRRRSSIFNLLFTYIVVAQQSAPSVFVKPASGAEMVRAAGLDLGRRPWQSSWMRPLPALLPRDRLHQVASVKKGSEYIKLSALDTYCARVCHLLWPDKALTRHPSNLILYRALWARRKWARSARRPIPLIATLKWQPRAPSEWLAVRKRRAANHLQAARLAADKFRRTLVRWRTRAEPR